MYQVPPRVWNQIAETQELRSPFAKRLFPLDEKKLDAALEQESQKLSKKGVSAPVQAAFLTVAPLLLENQAIARFQRENPGAAQALVNVVSVDEAVLISSQDRKMTGSQQKQLSKLLQTATA